MLAASLAMALGTILIRFTCTKSDPVVVTGWHMVLGGLPLIVKHCLQSEFQNNSNWSLFDWGLMLFASIFRRGNSLWIIFLSLLIIRK